MLLESQPKCDFPLRPPLPDRHIKHPPCTGDACERSLLARYHLHQPDTAVDPDHCLPVPISAGFDLSTLPYHPVAGNDLRHAEISPGQHTPTDMRRIQKKSRPTDNGADRRDPWGARTVPGSGGQDTPTHAGGKALPFGRSLPRRPGTKTGCPKTPYAILPEKHHADEFRAPSHRLSNCASEETAPGIGSSKHDP